MRILNLSCPFLVQATEVHLTVTVARLFLRFMPVVFIQKVNFFVGAFYDGVIHYGTHLNKTLEQGLDYRDGYNFTRRMWAQSFVGRSPNLSDMYSFLPTIRNNSGIFGWTIFGWLPHGV